MADKDENLRQEAKIPCSRKSIPAEAVIALAPVLETGTLTEKQGALATLAGLKGDATDQLLAEDGSINLIAGQAGGGNST